MKLRSLIIAIILFGMFIPALVTAETPAKQETVTIEGTIQGFNCISSGKTCPIGMEDPVAATETVFVLFTKKSDFYFIPNLDRALLSRKINKIVRVTGKKNAKSKSLTAEKFEVLEKDGTWRKIWPFPLPLHHLMQDGVKGMF